ncbi:hypothetical protein ABPG77_000847 [Micractinium sp. CCAP 211/92]
MAAVGPQSLTTSVCTSPHAMQASTNLALAIAVAADLAGAAALRVAAGSLLGSRQHGMQAATAYLCAAAVALLAGSGSVATSIQNAALLAAAVAALAPRGSLLSAMLLAAGSADWLPGAVLQGVPLALLAASWQRSSGGSGGASGSDSGAAPHVRVVARRLAGYLCCFAATAAALGHARSALPPVVAAAVGLAGGRSEAPAVRPADLAADPLAWVGTRVAQQPPHLRDAVVLPAATLEPGLGLHWYLLAQCFPQYRAFFLYVLRWLPTALMLPLALRFSSQPGLLLAAGALARCLLHPRPLLGTAALWVGLLPLAGPHLTAIKGSLPWLGLGQGLAALLSASAASLWLGGNGGNANFLYGMNLLWAGLQAVLLLRLLRAAAAAQQPATRGAEATAS